MYECDFKALTFLKNSKRLLLITTINTKTSARSPWGHYRFSMRIKTIQGWRKTFEKRQILFLIIQKKLLSKEDRQGTMEIKEKNTKTYADYTISPAVMTKKH